MKLLILNGSSCSGKSTIIKNIMGQKSRLFHLSYDPLRWLFSKYSRSEQYKDVWAVVFAIADAVFKMRYDIIADAVLYKERRNKLIELAKQAGYSVIEINLEADYNVLAKRFDERVAGALADPEKKISNLSKDRFKELYDIFHSEKNLQAITFNTDIQSVEEISQKILELLH